MKTASKIFFIFLIFLFAFFASVFCKEDNNFSSYIKEGSISSFNVIECDLAKNEETIASSVYIENIISSTKNNSQENKTEHSFFENKNQIQKIISYIYTKSYLENKSKNLLKISYSITPNAP